MVKRRRSIKRCDKYKLSPGRTIICATTGVELFNIGKDKGFTPTQADAMAQYIVSVLNRKQDFGKYYKKYMRW